MIPKFAKSTDRLPTDEALENQRLIGEMRLVFANGTYEEQESLCAAIRQAFGEQPEPV